MARTSKSKKNQQMTGTNGPLSGLREYLPLGLGALAILLLVWIYSPLMAAIAYGILLAYLSRPVVSRLSKWIGLGWASLVSLLIIVSLILGITVYTVAQVGYELSSISPDKFVDNFIGASKTVSHFISLHPQFKPFVTSLSKQLDVYTHIVSQYVINLILQTINLVVTLVMALVIAFFLLYDGRKLKDFLVMALPSEVVKQLDRIDNSLYGIYVGSLLSALIVGIITSATFFIFGLPYPVLSGVLAAILQFIPMVGPQLFLIPGAVVEIVFRNYLGSLVLLCLAVFLFFVPDNIIKPIILKRTTQVHPLLVLLSFIGGVVVFGAPGFVIGPFVLAIADGLIHAWLRWE